MTPAHGLQAAMQHNAAATKAVAMMRGEGTRGFPQPYGQQSYHQLAYGQHDAEYAP